MNQNSFQYICVLSTGKIIDFQIAEDAFKIAEDAFKNEGMPFFKQQRKDSGVVLAMPLAPVMGPGIFFEILVPQKYMKHAKEILSELPIDQTTTPDFWHFNPRPTSKSLWKFGVILIFCIATIILIFSFWGTLKSAL